ncbi:VOC family protein [Pacificoceanicola onchidii]|uniref:VOC family protein n=1 Tax=Pacificoceanicola onchidii TaxID=2562685 RepID=UPI0010A323D7|nr:VOC family protein [Pacificoceanicola onchidii]
MEQRISLITLGVRNMDAAAGFYEALGWRRVETQDGVVAFDLLGQTLGLYPLEDLARDMGLSPDEIGTGASTLSHNVDSREEVDALAAKAEAAGAKVLKAPHEVFWGGYISYFKDPEGHVWEVAHNPFSQLGPEGAFRWNGYG